MDPEEATSRLLQLRSAEPDVFHYTVKMHLSFLLDLSVDDCDCSFVYRDPSNSTKDTPGANLRRLIFTPRKGGAPSSSSVPHYKGVMDGAPLTQEGVCQVSQLVQFVGRPHNLTVEGIFRKSGNLKKVQVLKEMLNKGVQVDLDGGDFSVHECAAVLKKFLDGLSEPLLTDACYRAHCQVAQMDSKDDSSLTREKKIECLQLLFLLIPEVNVTLLKDLLSLLLKVARQEKSNKMSASNLGTMFAPSILCPRKLSPESLQSNHAMLTKAVAFMIEESEHLFRLPEKLRTDLEINFRRATTPVRPRTRFQGASGVVSPSSPSSSSFGPQSPVVNTAFSFVDREQTSRLAAKSSTEEALAELYAQVQAMPESAQKKKFVAKLNHANGQGMPGAVRNDSRQQRKKKGGNGEGGGGGGFMGLLTPKRSASKNNGQQRQKLEESKIGHRHASYSFKTPSKPPSQVLHSFKPNHETEEKKVVNQKLLSPQSSPAISVSPGTIDSILKRSEGGRRQQQENLDGSYTESNSSKKKKKQSKQPPPTPQRVSSLVEKTTTSETSPISKCAKRMSTEMQKSMMTPRSRKPVLAKASTVTLESNNPPLLSTFVIPDESPCQPPKYNEDEPDGVVDGEILKEGNSGDVENQEPQVEEVRAAASINENFDSSQTSSCFSAGHFFATLNEDGSESDNCSTEEEEHMITPGISSERDISEIIVHPVTTYSSRSLKKGFTEYLEAHEMQAPACGDASTMSEMLESSITSSVIGNEAQMLLNNELGLSDSMRAVLNGDDPDVAAVVMPSMLVPVDVDSPCSPSSEEEEEDKENNACCSNDGGSNVLSGENSSSCRDIPLPVNCGSAKKVSTSSIQVGGGSSGGGSGKRKRRSMTEVSDLNPISRRRAPQKRNIIFQTDV